MSFYTTQTRKILTRFTQMVVQIKCRTLKYYTKDNVICGQLCEIGTSGCFKNWQIAGISSWLVSESAIKRV